MDFRIKTITYLALFFIISSITAQNNLVFNKVLTFKLISGQTAEVPEGKTWKIESTSTGTGSNGALNPFYLNKDIVDYGDPLTQPQERWNLRLNSSTNIWLQEGTILRGTNTSEGAKFSIIEFNIEPISSSSGTNTGSSGVSSEGLVFSKVINYQVNGSAPTSYGGPMDIIEIPEGKVWKITRVTVTFTSTTYPYSTRDVSATGAYLGDILIFYRPATNGYSNSSYDNFPIWINSGLKELTIGRTSTNEDKQYKITISAIEYNE
ncbi:hypothetical protein N9737_05515 [Polaribacter sp.]|nr:hypothetical protein [Polaribacter sp.]